VVVPAGIIGLVWQVMVIPRMPPTHHVSPLAMARLVSKPVVALGMSATALAFMGQHALATYIRPFLETVTGLDVKGVSLALLGLGLGGLAGTLTAGFVLRDHLRFCLMALPAMLAILAAALVSLGQFGLVVGVILVVWGLFSTPVPVAWGSWMTRVIPNELEAGGGVQVALVQLAITGGAFSGGLLFDTAGWASAFLFAAALLLLATGLALVAGRNIPAQQP
jgi:predicted MFS family arabinose efflux permease